MRRVLRRRPRNGVPAKSDRVLELVNIVKEYGGTPPVRALDGVSLQVDRGELVGIVGASGSGKSTLMNIIGTLDRPTSGHTLIEDEAVESLPDAALAGLRAASIGFVFQQFHLLEGSSAAANVSNGLLYQGVNPRRRRELAVRALKRVGLGHRIDHRASKLSGGERQRVAIARAIVADPAIVLADEPTGNLDSKTSDSIVGLLRQLNAEGSTILVITHDRDLAATLPRRVTISDGRVVHDERLLSTQDLSQPDLYQPDLSQPDLSQPGSGVPQ